MKKQITIRALLGLALCSIAAPAVAAQSAYPAKPVRIIVPLGAGGANDTIARFVAERLHAELGQPFIVENRPGAAANLGTEYVVRSPADGYTLLLGSSSGAVNVTLYPKLTFHPARDLAPISMIAKTSMLLVVHPALPVRTIKDIVALARKHPGELTYASAGYAGPTHMAAELFKSLAKVDIRHIPYKSGAEAHTSVISGQTSMAFGGTISGIPQVKAGRLRAIAVSAPVRVDAAPDVPTIAESGVPGYSLWGWMALYAPATTPQDVIGRLNAALARALNTPEAKRRLAELGADVDTGSPAALAEFLQSEIALYAKLIPAAGVRPE